MAISVFPAPTPSTGRQQYEQLFTSSGTWTRPTGVTQVEVEMIAGSGSSNGNCSGAGGYYKGIVPVSGNATITIGAGGASGAKGGDTIFNNAIKCVGSNNAGTDSHSGSVVFTNQPGFSPTAVYETTSITNLGYQVYQHVQQHYGAYYMFGSQGLAYWGMNPFGGMSSFPWNLGNSSSYTPKLQGTYLPGYNNNQGAVIHAITVMNHNNTAYYGGTIYFSANYSFNSPSTTDCGAAYIAGFVAGGDGFYVSQVNNNVLRKTTNMQTWTNVTTNLPNNYSYSLFYVNGRYYALNYRGDNAASVYTSTDAITWTAITVASPPSTSTTQGLERQTYQDGTSLYYFHTSYNGIIKLTNGSATQINNGFGAFAVGSGYIIMNSRWVNGSGNSLYDITTGSPVVTGFFNTYSTSQIIGFDDTGFWMNVGGGWSYGPVRYSAYAGLPFNRGVSNASGGAISPAKYGTNGFYLAGFGTDKGWGQGADSAGFDNRQFGSGVTSSRTGNPGAILVRWWV